MLLEHERAPLPLYPPEQRVGRRRGLRLGAERPVRRVELYIIINIIISGSACSTGGVHSQAWSASGIGLGSKSGALYIMITYYKSRFDIIGQSSA
jgi:hypothetical protein